MNIVLCVKISSATCTCIFYCDIITVINVNIFPNHWLFLRLEHCRGDLKLTCILQLGNGCQGHPQFLIITVTVIQTVQICYSWTVHMV